MLKLFGSGFARLGIIIFSPGYRNQVLVLSDWIQVVSPSHLERRLSVAWPVGSSVVHRKLHQHNFIEVFFCMVAQTSGRLLFNTSSYIVCTKVATQ